MRARSCAAALSQVPAVEAQAHGAFSVVCEWGNTVSSMETLPAEELGMEEGLPGEAWGAALQGRRCCLVLAVGGCGGACRDGGWQGRLAAGWPLSGTPSSGAVR